MSNPFLALQDALRPVFKMALRNGKSNYPKIQQLKSAVDAFNPNDTETFIKLYHALCGSLSHIAQWRLDFVSIRNSMDKLALSLNMPKINWDRMVSKSNTPSFFPHCAFQGKNCNKDLLTWLAEHSGTNVATADIETQIRILLQYSENLGFSTKLNEHLTKHPNFLFTLIAKSEKHFTQIANSRLVLYLTDEQLAHAIIRFLPRLLKQHANRMHQTDNIVEKINKMLSNGRSVSTILRNTQAKFILEESELWQAHQKPNEITLNPLAAGNPPSPQRVG